MFTFSINAKFYSITSKQGLSIAHDLSAKCFHEIKSLSNSD